MSTTNSANQSTRAPHGKVARSGAAALTGLVLAGAIVGGLNVTQAESASAISMPGPMDIISGGAQAYSMYNLCKSNESAGLPCLQSTGTTVTQIYTNLNLLSTKFDGFLTTYDKQSKDTNALLNQIILNQKDAATKQAWEGVRSDLETAHVGAKIYQGYLDCFSKAAGAAASGKPGTGTCINVNTNGVVKGEQPANEETVMRMRSMLIANESKDPAIGTVGYQLSPTDLMQRIGGRSDNAKDGGGVVHAIVDQDLTKEKMKQGVRADKALTVYPRDLVNTVNRQVKDVVDNEAAYLTTRIAAMGLRGNPESTRAAQDLADLAADGRADSSPVLSLSSQQGTYSFPHDLDKNSTFVVFDNKAYTLRSLGNSALQDADYFRNFPTMQQTVALNKSIIDSGSTYSKVSAAAPDAIPADTAKRQPGQPDSGGLWYVKGLQAWDIDARLTSGTFWYSYWWTPDTEDITRQTVVGPKPPTYLRPTPSEATLIPVKLFDGRVSFENQANAPLPSKDHVNISTEKSWANQDESNTWSVDAKANYNQVTANGLVSPVWANYYTDKKWSELPFDDSWEYRAMAGRGILLMGASMPGQGVQQPARMLASKMDMREIPFGGLLQTPDNMVG